MWVEEMSVLPGDDWQDRKAIVTLKYRKLQQADVRR
jgi:hypothetical protein